MTDPHQICSHCNELVSKHAEFCSSCGSPVVVPTSKSNTPDATEPAVRIRNAIGRRARFLYVGAAALLSAVFLYIFVESLPGGENPVIARQPVVSMPSMYSGQVFEQTTVSASVAQEHITFPLSELLDKRIVAFEFENGGTSIPLIAYISSEGKLVTGVRFCEPCNSKTFRIEGTELACGNCETRWVLNTLEGLQGACQKYPPQPLKSEIVGNQVRINTREIANWKTRI